MFYEALDILNFGIGKLALDEDSLYVGKFPPDGYRDTFPNIKGLFLIYEQTDRLG